MTDLGKTYTTISLFSFAVTFNIPRKLVVNQLYKHSLKVTEMTANLFLFNLSMQFKHT